MQATERDEVIVHPGSAYLDRSLLAIPPELVQLGRRSMTQYCISPGIEQRRLKLRLPGPRMIAEAIDVALRRTNHPVATRWRRASSFTPHGSGLLAIKDAVLVAREFSEDRFRM